MLLFSSRSVLDKCSLTIRWSGFLSPLKLLEFNRRVAEAPQFGAQRGSNFKDAHALKWRGGDDLSACLQFSCGSYLESQLIVHGGVGLTA